ncbi:MAG: hypothetical protein GXP32_03730 [Kiritimatiellaeota bacterium]|nr:hypothetical protein [Kiritimatiellota bacterium]
MFPHRAVAARQIAADPDMEVFYHNNYIPVQYHEIPSFNCWKNQLYELNLFFKGRMDVDELWFKIDWLRRRDTVVHKLAL